MLPANEGMFRDVEDNNEVELYTDQGASHGPGYNGEPDGDDYEAALHTEDVALQIDAGDGLLPEVTRGDYGTYPQYVILIFVWFTLVLAYIIVLENAVQNHDYLGPRGSPRRTRSFDVLAFFRAGFASVHVPVIVSVLASTIPYWTTTDAKGGGTAKLDEDSSVDTNSSVTQLFYLADRDWAGLIGWITTSYNSSRVARPSSLWLHLTLIVAVAYIGFPLLSVAYVVESSQYWIPEQFQAPAMMGGSNMTFNQALDFMTDLNNWVGDGELSARSDHNVSLSRLMLIKSSQRSGSVPAGLSNQTVWTSGDSVLTLDVGVKSNTQLPLAAVRIKAFCRQAMYDNNVLLPGSTSLPGDDLSFEFAPTRLSGDSPGGHKLVCKKTCLGPVSSDAYTCSSNSSYLDKGIWSTDLRSGMDNRNPQLLSCGSIEEDSSDGPGAVARFQFAMLVNGYEHITNVRTCDFAVSYVRPTINTLIGEYIESTSDRIAATAVQTPGGFTPAQLLELSMAGLLKMYHNGPPPQGVRDRSLSSGFNWISWLSPKGASKLNDHAYNNIWYLLQDIDIPSGNIFFQFPPEHILDGKDLYRTSGIDEETFLRPLAALISRPEFFTNASTDGVSFRTDLSMVHGRMPAALAIIVLLAPILWTLTLAISANREKRWTASLNAFAMFRLGGAWRESLQHLQMASLREAKEELSLIPGTCQVDVQEGSVRLIHSVNHRAWRSMPYSRRVKGKWKRLRRTP